VEPADDDLGGPLVEREARAQPFDFVAGRVLEQPQDVGGVAGAVRAYFEGLADGPEAEEADAVFALEHERAALFGGEVALARMADGRGDVREGGFAIELGDDAVAVVDDAEASDAALAQSGDTDGPRLGGDGVPFARV